MTFVTNVGHGTSEIQSQHELQDAAARLDGTRDIAISAGHLPERRADVGISATVAEVGHVENIERRRTELDVLRTFTDLGPLHDTHIVEPVPVLVEVSAPAEF